MIHMGNYSMINAGGGWGLPGRHPHDVPWLSLDALAVALDDQQPLQDEVQLLVRMAVTEARTVAQLPLPQRYARPALGRRRDDGTATGADVGGRAAKSSAGIRARCHRARHLSAC
jgi:hypothetical protein